MAYVMKRIGFVALLAVIVIAVHQLKIWLVRLWHAPAVATTSNSSPPASVVVASTAPQEEPQRTGNPWDEQHSRLEYLNKYQAAIGAWNNRLAANIPPSPSSADASGPAPSSTIDLLTSGAEFRGNRVDTRVSESGIEFSLSITSYHPRTGAVRGTISWPAYGSKHVFSGWLTETSLRFREVKRLKKGECPLGLCYNLFFEPQAQQLHGWCFFNFFNDGKVPAEIAAVQPDLVPLDLDPKKEHVAWPPVEETGDLATAHNPFGPGAGTDRTGQGPGEVTISLSPLSNGEGQILNKGKRLWGQLSGGGLFTGVTIYGRFKFRVVSYRPATGDLEARSEWYEVFPGSDPISTIMASTPFYSQQKAHLVHKIVGRLWHWHDLQFIERFTGYECRYRLASNADGDLEGRVWIIDQVRSSRDFTSYPVHMKFRAKPD